MHSWGEDLGKGIYAEKVVLQSSKALWMKMKTDVGPNKLKTKLICLRSLSYKKEKCEPFPREKSVI